MIWSLMQWKKSAIMTKSIHYILHTPDHSYPQDSVLAENKTEARKMISDAYRQDTPRQATASGFHPFSKCRIEWIEEERQYADERDLDIPSDVIISLDVEREKGSDTPLDPRIGILQSNGSLTYYAHIGAHREYKEGSLEYVQSLLD
jgi:hypothetical protein